MNIHLDMYQTLAVAVLVLMLGSFLRKKIHFLEKFCIPAPVIGGLLFAIFTCICYSTGVAEFSFDDTLREVCMVFFFTSVGFQANLKVLKSGGKSMAVFLGLVIALIITQNFLAVGLSKLLGLNPLIGMCTGSIPMVGGHGTAGAFGPVLEDFNIHGATTICTAAATFGLITGSLIGGPLGKRLVEKKNLLATVASEDDSLLVEDEKKHERHTNMYASAVFQLILAIGLGTIFSYFLTKTGLTFPIYIGAMLAAALIRNIVEYSHGNATIHMGEINDLGGISLSLFLGMAMITLKLWELASLALPLIILLSSQVILIAVFTYFIDEVKEYKNIGTAYVTSAMELSDAQKAAVEKRLLETTKYVKFEMHYDVDSELIGGMVIRIGDRVVDSSVRTKLYDLTRELSKIQLKAGECAS